MNNNSTNPDELIQLLDGELQGETLQQLQHKIAGNPQLAAELESLRMAKAAVASYGLRKSIGNIHKEMMQELDAAAAPPRIGMRRIIQYTMRVAAILAIVLGSTAVYQYFSATPEKLFSDNYQAFTLRETRSSNADALETLYKKGDFAGVTNAFSQLAAPQPTDYFLNGCAALANNNATAAISSLTALQQHNQQNNTHFYEDDATYYLALAYLQHKDLDRALPLFEKIHADPGHPYHNRISGWWLRKLQHLAHNK